MAKHKLTVKDKMDIRDIIFKSIETQHPIFDYNTYITEEKKRIEDYLETWRCVCWKQTDEVQKFLNQFELWQKQTYGYSVIDVGHDNACNVHSEHERTFVIEVNSIWDLRNKTPLVLPELYKDMIINDNHCVTFYDIMHKIAKYEADRINLEIQKREREFMDIYSNFKNILYSCKYLEDVGNMIPLPEITKYIEGRLLKQCTTLAPINKESINFVDNYIKSIKSA